jgi:membrane protein insertase Oxa1/YidC/SpoIIIJ
MQPLPEDPQQRQQAKMMRWMPVLFGFFLYGTASGLTLYMTMSALWSIGETWVIRKLWLAKLENALK